MSKQRQARRAAAAKEKRQQRASRQPAQRLSPSRGRQAVRALDGFHGMRQALASIASNTNEWAGIPMPIEGERLVIEPSFPWAEVLSGEAIKEDAEDEGWQLRNKWYCPRWRCEILVMQDPEGRVVHGKVPAFHHIRYDLSTLGCSDVWGIEQEGRAVQLLGTMLRHRQFKQYLMTGMFLETSKRSGTVYLFRRLKPTIAIAAGSPDDGMKILAALCMHPIAYYEGSWAGAMVPTDDVIAHLSLMRGDEHMFWKRCNQHPPYRPEAGL